MTSATSPRTWTSLTISTPNQLSLPSTSPSTLLPPMRQQSRSSQRTLRKASPRPSGGVLTIANRAKLDDGSGIGSLVNPRRSEGDTPAHLRIVEDLGDRRRPLNESAEVFSGAVPGAEYHSHRQVPDVSADGCGILPLAQPQRRLQRFRWDIEGGLSSGEPCVGGREQPLRIGGDSRDRRYRCNRPAWRHLFDMASLTEQPSSKFRLHTLCHGATVVTGIVSWYYLRAVLRLCTSRHYTGRSR